MEAIVFDIVAGGESVTGQKEKTNDNYSRGRLTDRRAKEMDYNCILWSDPRPSLSDLPP